jgi:hypothetical protein
MGFLIMSPDHLDEWRDDHLTVAAKGESTQKVVVEESKT